MKDYTVEAIINFNDIVEKDKNGNNTYREKGTVWKCTKERYEQLKSKNAVILLGIDEKKVKPEKTTVEDVDNPVDNSNVSQKTSKKRTKKTVENKK